MQRACDDLGAVLAITSHLKHGKGHTVEQQTRRGNRANTRKWRAVVHVKDEAPPMASVLVGEFLYNLRSALDLLAYHLAIENSRPKGPPRGTGFPIHDSEKGFFLRDAKSASGYAFSSGRHKTRGMSDAAQSFIEANQPYTRGNKKQARAHPLWLLHDACNADKHIAPHVAVRKIEPRVWIADKVGTDVNLFVKTGPFKDGDVLAAADLFYHGAADAKVEMNVEIATNVVFENGPLDGLSLTVLPEILQFVLGVIVPGLDPDWPGLDETSPVDP